MRPVSIQVRLTASFTAILALTFLLIGFGVWLALNHSIEITADRELHSRLAQLRKYFDSFSPDDLAHLEEEFREEALLSQASANIRISDRQGNWVFHTPETDHWPVETLNVGALPERGETKTIWVRNKSFRVLTAPVRLGAVEVGLPVDEFEEVKTGFLWLISLGSPAVLLLAGLAGYWMSGRALHPVDAIAKSAARINAEDLSARLPSLGSGDELDRLSKVLNGMLARLESSFKRISEFTADASHELRTPVAIIQTTADLMQSRPRTLDEHLEAWRTVARQTQATAHLIADLLTLARADAGKTDFEFQHIDFSKVVGMAAEQMRVLAEAKGLRMTTQGTEQPCPLHGDPEALRRVILILLDNAIKFTSSPGEVRVALQNGQSATVTVSDSGIGIGKQELPFIFGRFYRVSKDRSRHSGGTGLGLSIGQWIVQEHGGQLTAQSSPGDGSKFKMTLPLNRG